MRTVLIVDDNPGVGEALALALSLRDIRPLVALSPEQELIRSGAREFLTQPVVLEDLLKALQRLAQQRAPRDGSTPNGNVKKTTSVVVAVLGSRGGIGWRRVSTLTLGSVTVGSIVDDISSTPSISGR